MAERMTSRDDAEYIKFCLMQAIKDLEDEGYTRAEVGASMVGIGGGIVAAHLGIQKGVDVLESARDACLASSPSA